MSYNDHFEKLDVWQKAMEFNKRIYAITLDLPEESSYGLKAFLRNASIAIASNIAEGAGSYPDNDHNDYYQKAYSATFEVATLLHLSDEIKIIPRHTCQELRTELEQITRLLRDRVIESNPDRRNTLTGHTGYFVHPTAIVDHGAVIGKDTRIWHYTHIMERTIIGEKCSIGQNVMIANDVVLGNNVKVQNNVSIYTGVICDDDVFLGPSMVFTNVINPRSAVNRKEEFLKTRVNKGATIGANATIVCGYDIGSYAFIGAGAVVTKAVPDYALLVGNPARQIGWMSAHGHRLDFENGNKTTCPGSGETYLLENGTVKPV